MMGRPKEFDPTVALDRAMDLFWAQGYEATSIDDLLQAMEIQRGSLYATFGSKHELFLLALERYRTKSIEATERTLAQADTPLDALAATLTLIVKQALEHKRRWGCLITNSSVEMATRDRDILSQVLAHRERIEALFRHVIEQGQIQGEIRDDESAAALAGYLFTVIQGLRVMTKTVQGDELDSVVRITVESLRR